MAFLKIKLGYRIKGIHSNFKNMPDFLTLLLLLSLTLEMMLAATLPAARTKLRNVKALLTSNF